MMLSFRMLAVKLLITVIVLTGLVLWNVAECDVPHYKILRNNNGKQVKWWGEDLPVKYTINTDSCDAGPEASVGFEVRFGFNNWSGDSPEEWIAPASFATHVIVGMTGGKCSKWRGLS